MLKNYYSIRSDCLNFAKQNRSRIDHESVQQERELQHYYNLITSVYINYPTLYMLCKSFTLAAMYVVKSMNVLTHTEMHTHAHATS